MYQLFRNAQETVAYVDNNNNNNLSAEMLSDVQYRVQILSN